MFFPRNLKDGSKIYEKGKVYEIADTPGSINRWIIRGCTIVEEEPKKEEKKVEPSVKIEPIKIEPIKEEPLVAPSVEEKHETEEKLLGKVKKKVIKKSSKSK